MTEQLSNPTTPKLRFPEFKDSGAWEEKPLGEIVKRTISKNKDVSVTFVLTNSATQGIVSQREYFDKDIANQNNLEGYYIVHKDDFVYNPRISKDAPVGPIKRNHLCDGVMSPLYTVFSFTKGNLNFFEHYFSTTKWHKYLQSCSNDGVRHDRMNISNDDLFQMPLPFPPPSEQTKIADCLSSLDDLITAEGEKLEALKQHKKGLMQNLFPQAGESLPRLRFPEFKDSGAWEEKQLGEMGIFKSGIGFNELEQGGKSGIPFFKVSDMNLELNTYEMKIANHYVSQEQIKRLKYKPIYENSIIFAKVGAAIFLERKRIAKDFLFDNNMMAFIPNDKINLQFIKQLFDIIEFSKYAQVGALPSYNSSDLQIIKISFPADPKEQQRIADCLSSLDEIITAEGEKLDALKQHKKGLMQGLFV
jgi:type I restriction enzyme S subunit